jgi:hypothetical protein
VAYIHGHSTACRAAGAPKRSHTWHTVHGSSQVPVTQPPVLQGGRGGCARVDAGYEENENQGQEGPQAARCGAPGCSARLPAQLMRACYAQVARGDTISTSPRDRKRKAQGHGQGAVRRPKVQQQQA